MNRRKILTVVGAGPQFIKAASVGKILSARADLHEVMVHTGQHFDSNMSIALFDELNIPAPAYQLEFKAAGTAL
jgi:UDP-GlcNAc3NAcA epimerase